MAINKLLTSLGFITFVYFEPLLLSESITLEDIFELKENYLSSQSILQDLEYQNIQKIIISCSKPKAIALLKKFGFGKEFIDYAQNKMILKQKTKYALFIGISEYLNSDYNLKYAAENTVDLQKSLVTLGFAKENMCVLTNQNATVDRIDLHIKTWQDLQPECLFLYLRVRGNYQNNKFVWHMYDQSIETSYLTKLVDNISPVHTIIFLDVVPMENSELGWNPYLLANQITSSVVVSSTSENDTAKEYEQLKSTVFHCCLQKTIENVKNTSISVQELLHQFSNTTYFHSKQNLLTSFNPYFPTDYPLYSTTYAYTLSQELQIQHNDICERFATPNIYKTVLYAEILEKNFSPYKVFIKHPNIIEIISPSGTKSTKEIKEQSDTKTFFYETIPRSFFIDPSRAFFIVYVDCNSLWQHQECVKNELIVNRMLYETIILPVNEDNNLYSDKNINSIYREYEKLFKRFSLDVLKTYASVKILEKNFNIHQIWVRRGGVVRIVPPSGISYEKKITSQDEVKYFLQDFVPRSVHIDPSKSIFALFLDPDSLLLHKIWLEDELKKMRVIYASQRLPE